MTTPPNARTTITYTTTELDSLVDAHLAAELRGDLPAVLATLAGDIVHDVIGAPAPSVGHDEVAAFYRSLWADLAVDAMRPVRRLHGPDFVVDEVDVEARAVGTPFGLPGHGRPVRFRLVHVFEVVQGQISRETAALDVPAIMAQLGGEGS